MDTMRDKFAGMQSAFETFATDMTAYHDFLIDAAENYETVEQEGKGKGRRSGKGLLNGPTVSAQRAVFSVPLGQTFEQEDIGYA